MAGPRDAARRRPAHAALIAAGAALWSLVACHRPATPPDVAAPLVGHSFGDTATYGIQILALDRAREVAKVSLRTPSQLIVLAVIPGREIELILPSDIPGQATRQVYPVGVSAIGMQRYEVSNRPVSADADAQARLAYSRCMSQAQAQARRQARPVRRDSTGKVISGDPGEEAAQLARLERQCDRMETASNRPVPPARLPARAPADRYLVVLASALPLSVAELSERLATLTAVAPDVATTIEAIAAGLYVGLPVSWSGSYVPW